MWMSGRVLSGLSLCFWILESPVDPASPDEMWKKLPIPDGIPKMMPNAEFSKDATYNREIFHNPGQNGWFFVDHAIEVHGEH